MDYTMVRNVVNRALEQMALREMSPDGHPTAAQKISASVVDDLFPTLQAMLAVMVMANKSWVANNISEKVTEAAMGGQTLAGYAPSSWVIWGALLPRVVEFLSTPFDVTMPGGATVSMTPEQILIMEYLKETNA